MSSPVKPPSSGRLGQKSPKKRVLDSMADQELSFIKLKSPMKRSMNELNKTALARALRVKFKGLAKDENNSSDDELLNDEEQVLADRIIEESKKDGLGVTHLEMDEEEEEEEMRLKDEVEFEQVEDNSNDDNDLNNNKKSKNRNPFNSDDDVLEFGSDDEGYQSPVESRRRLPRMKSQEDKIALSPVKRAKYKKRNTDNEQFDSPKRKYVKFNDPSHPKPLKEEELKPRAASAINLMDIPRISKEEDALLNFQNPEKALFYDGHEGFFEQQKLKNKKPSNNTMAMAPDITYDEYHRYNKLIDVICDEQIGNLNKYYKLQYTQWLFELQEGFNLVYYGVGSKRLLLLEFIQKFLLTRIQGSKCIVVNGYNPEFHMRHLIKSIYETVFHKKIHVASQWHESIITLAEDFKKRPKAKLIILVNNLDGAPLRSDKFQTLMSEISRIPQIHFICTIDNINTPLFWNSSLLTNFNFIWHNLTTFKPYTTEVSFKDPLNMGKSKAFVGSKGVKHLLNSLTVNAKNLFKHLVMQQLEQIDTNLSEQDMEKRALVKGTIKTSVDLKDFYQLCLSEFITSNEMNFRSLLHEFVDHKMTELTRDSAGIEVLYIPFTVDEMEKLLEEEFSDD